MTWRSVPFGAVCHLVNGKAFQPTDWSDAGIPIVRIQNLNGPEKPFNYWAGSLEKQVVVRGGDLLLAWSGTPGSSFGTHIWSGPAAVLNQHIFRCDLDHTSVTPKWARFAVNARLNRLIDLAHGGVGLKHVTRGVVEELEIPLPPLAEQRRIAEILDKADGLRAKRRAALAQLDTLTQSIFLDMFGDPGAPTATYEQLGNHLIFVTSGGRGWADFYSSTGSRFIRSLDVQMNHISEENAVFVRAPNNAEAQRTRARTGDILLTITGSRIGRVAPLPQHLDGSHISQHVAILRADVSCIEPRFLAFFLSLECGGQKQIARAQYGQTKPGLNFEQIRRFEVPLPAIQLQREFVCRLMALEKLKLTQHEFSTNLDALFFSLQHRAFRGEL